MLDHLHWMADLAELCPGRVFLYTHHGFDRETLVAMARFLDLEPEERWIGDALAAYRVQPGYEHSPEHVEQYEALVRRRFAGHPRLRGELLAFTARVSQDSGLLEWACAGSACVRATPNCLEFQFRWRSRSRSGTIATC